MYRSVYNHRLNEVCNWLLEQIIKTAREIGPNKIWVDKNMSEWLWNHEKMSLESFLSNDDIVTGYHINEWQNSCFNNLSMPNLNLITLPYFSSSSSVSMTLDLYGPTPEMKEDEPCCNTCEGEKEKYSKLVELLDLVGNIEINDEANCLNPQSGFSDDINVNINYLKSEIIEDIIKSFEFIIRFSRTCSYISNPIILLYYLTYPPDVSITS